MPDELKVWEDPSGRVRLHYRTSYTGDDAFERTYIVMGFSSDPGQVMVNSRTLSKWTLERFVRLYQVKDGEAWGPETPFVWDALARIPGAGGWPVMAANAIYAEVVDKAEAALAVEKKTSETRSAPISSAVTPRGRRSRSSISPASAKP